MSDEKAGWKPHSNPWVIATAVTLAAFMEVLDTTIVNVSLPHIAGSLAVSNDDATWVLTTYLIANGTVLTISGALSRKFGRKRYFMVCIAVFTLASLGCGLSTSFPELLIFRLIQGLFGGGLQPTQQAIILDTFPPEKRQQAFSLTAIAIIMAPVIGPLLGGYLTDAFSWHLIFLINVPVGLLTLFGVWRSVEDSPVARKATRTAPPIDYLGILFISLALGCAEVAVDRGEDLDWLGSPFVRLMFAISAASLLLGVIYLLTTKNPIVDLRVFKDRNFALGFTEIGIMGLVLYTSAVLIPQFAQRQLGYTATLAGLVLAPGAALLAMLIPLVGRAMKSVPAKYVIAAGGAALGGALFYSMDLVPNESFFDLALARAAQTAALALLFVPISVVAYATLPKRQEADASALFSMARNVFGGFGISIGTALVTQQEQVNQQLVVPYLSPGREGYAIALAQIKAGLIANGDAVAKATSQASREMFQILRAQVAVLAYMDVFFITGLLALIIVPTALALAAPAKSDGGD